MSLLPSSVKMLIPKLATRRPTVCLILSALLALPFLIQLPAVRTVDNVDYFTLEGDPDVAFYDSIKKTFGDDEFFLIAFTSDSLFTAQSLRAIVDITAGLKGIPEVRKVQSLANVDYIHGSTDYFEVRPFLERIPDDAVSLEKLRRDAVENPLYVGNLISADGRTTALAVFPKAHASEDGSFRKRLLDKARQILAEHAGLGDSFHLAGWTVTNLSLSQYMKSDVAVFIPVTYLFIALTIWLVFRSVRLTILAVINISVCTGATMGLFPLMGVTLNNVTTIVPPLVMALALADSVHIFSHLDRSLLESGLDPAGAMEHVLQRVIVPCFLTSLTTAVGFISLIVSDIPPIKEFGWLASAGMLFEFAFSFLLLPPLLLLCRPESVFIHSLKAKGLNVFLSRLSDFIEARPRRIALSAALLVAVAVGFAATIRVETNLLEYFKESSPLRQDLRYVEEHLSGVGTVDVSIRSPRRDAFREPESLAVIQDIQGFAGALPGVDKTMSMVDFLKDMNMSFHDEDSRFHAIPESRELVSQYLLLYDSDELGEFVTSDYDHARILLRISEHSSAGQARIIDALRGFLARHENADLQIRITGRAVQDVNTIDALVWGQVESLALAAVVITLIMFLALGSVRSGALSLVPNIFPIILNFGVMGALGIPLNTSTALISVVALGIAVDDTIHFLTEYNAQRGRGTPIPHALRTVTREKGLGICSSSIILVIGFGVLVLSSFVPTISFGGLSAVIMITAWVGDMVVLPAFILSRRPASS
ncbi:efflux RND transporter permease subunit [Desulfomicrobium salsuginis]